MCNGCKREEMTPVLLTKRFLKNMVPHLKCLWVYGAELRQDWNGAQTRVHTLMTNPIPMTHLSHLQIPQMKTYLDATATVAFNRWEQTDSLLWAKSEASTLPSIGTIKTWYTARPLNQKKSNNDQGVDWCDAVISTFPWKLTMGAW